MEKMISVINGNLRNVVNGIIEHRKDTETTLENTKNEIDRKVDEARKYKGQVETARTKISEYEADIVNLEKDLAELTEKFGGKDFKTILDAGNKEINGKIIEKRVLINEQGKIIIDLTDKAHKLKDDLIKLREKRDKTTENLKKAIILEKYYESKINNLIEYSENHSDELESEIEYATDDNLISATEIDNVDIHNIEDGAIFEEIDEISSSGPDDELLQSVLDNPDEEEDYEDENNENDEIDLTMTEQLEKMISEAKTIIAKNSELMASIPEVDKGKKSKKDVGVVDLTNEDDYKTIPTPVVSEEKDEEIEEMVKELSEDDKFIEDIEEQPTEVEETIDINLDDDVDMPISSEHVIDLPVEEEEDGDLLSALKTIGAPELDMDTIAAMQEDDAEELDIVNNDLPTIDISSSNDFKIDDDNIVDPTEFAREEKDFNLELEECGLNADSFKGEDLISIQLTFDKENTKGIISVLEKYEYNKEILYNYPNILVDLTSQNLDKILNLLFSTGAKKSDVDLVLDKIDKININVLEQNIMNKSEIELTEAIYSAVPESADDSIFEKLGLDSKDVTTMKKNVQSDDFKKIQMFGDIVLINYNYLKNLNIKNLKDCITKYPHRFLNNPSSFLEIMDKYDTEDLIRCINKNAAVIDKL